MRPLRLAIVGYGKIAADQHAPAIAAHPRLELAATVSRGGKGVDGIPSFTSHQELLAAKLDIDAVAITTPPDARRSIARDCIAAGLHVMLEKPPATTLGEAEDIVRAALESQVTLLATWHAQANAGVHAAAEAIRATGVTRMEVTWREDVRKWHPGQDWIWRAGGFGVFDPGINALSVLARILPDPIFVRSAKLKVPQGRETPIAATLQLASDDFEISADFDWREQGDEKWNIAWTDRGGTEYLLSGGGAALSRNSAPVPIGEHAGEYPELYSRFVDLIDCRASEADLSPLRIVADAFLLGTRKEVEPFSW